MNGLWFERSEDEVRGVLRLVEADPQVVQVVHLGEVGEAPVGRLLGRGDEDHGEERDERHALADELHTRVPQEAARLQHNNHHGGDIWERKGNVLFIDALNTFYLRLYGVRHMVKDHSDSKRGNPLPPHGLLFPIDSKGSFICTIPQTGYHIPRPLIHQSWSTGWNKK